MLLGVAALAQFQTSETIILCGRRKNDSPQKSRNLYIDVTASHMTYKG